ncbi:MAG TPA: ABC transporter ATP-binding protein [Streptosporangiaceae bacterium]|jgi:peptide/nickel transport system ATP-binding protein
MTTSAGHGSPDGVGAAASAVASRPAMLEAREITKHFPAGRRGAAVHAVDGVSLALPAGGITAIVGESGSGKSTLARLFAQLLRPTSGQLLLDGQVAPSGRGGRRRYAQRVQMVLQDPFASLNPVHDVRYHLTRPLKVHGLGPAGSLDEALAGLLERVALTPPERFLRKYPHELSGGQRQRVAIARALAVRPRVLLADEPVSMLDVSIRLGILNLLADLRENEGMTILYITHDIASARYLADEIAVMYAGRLVESAPAGSVTDQPAHPYTQLLLSAAPDPDRPEPVQLSGRGSVPSLLTPPPGCRFHPRCPHAMEICSQLPPPPAEVAPGHVSACWLHAPERLAGTVAPPERRHDGPPTRLADDPSHQQGRQTRPALRHPPSPRPRHGQSKEAGDEPAGHNGV